MPISIKDFVPRLYQETILASAAEKSTLVVLPTGLGKTAIAFLLAVERLTNFPQSKILFLAPTKPLVEQHNVSFQRHLEGIDEKQFVVFTGAVSPDTRATMWKDAKIIFSTPQGLENDIISRRITLEDVSLLIFDEAHRATGDYAYNFVANQYNKLAKFPRILALTASPGNDMEKISEVCKNLFIEAIEIRTEKDPDVRPYVKEMDMKWIEIHLPDDIKQARQFLNDVLTSRIKEIKSKVNSNIRDFSKKELISLQAELHAQLASGDRDFETMKAVSLIAEAVKVQHALELLETQTIFASYQYFEKLYHESQTSKTKATKNLVADSNFRSAYILVKKIYEQGHEHPKIAALMKIIGEEVLANSDVKIIVFNQYRDTATKMVEEMNAIPGIKAKIFVGQMKKKDTGLSQKKQKEVLDKFRNGEFNILVSTSVGEEGLDIIAVDLVIFYEPIPSAIRTIQRRGRTGRQMKGRVIILMTKNTRDEAYRWTAVYKERRMHQTLLDIKNKISFTFTKPEATLNKYIKEEIFTIIADHREKSTGILRELIDLGVKINLEQLDVADYVVSSRCAIEVKTVPDFVNSIVDGRLLDQLKRVKQSYELPVVIVEGTEDIYSVRKVHPNAIRGMLATIAVSYGIPIIQTKNPRDSAALIAIIAKREQTENTQVYQAHSEKRQLTLQDQQEYIISAFPGIGNAIAKPILEKFKTVKNVVNATEKELMDIEQIGPKKAKKIREVLDSEYQKDKQ